MAEVLGTVASIVQLVQAAAVLTDTGARLYHRLIDAPEELRALISQLSVISAELVRIQTASDRGHTSLLTPELRHELQDSLTEANLSLRALESQITKSENIQKFGNRVKWACKDRRRANAMRERLQGSRDRLSYLMQTISFQSGSIILKSLDEIHVLVFISTCLVCLIQQELLTSTSANNTPIAKGELTVAKKARPDRRLVTSPRSLGAPSKFFGVDGVVISTKQGHHTDHSISLRTALPLAQILGPYIFIISLNVRTFPLDPWAFRLNKGGCALSRALSRYHPFMEACARGDLQDVRRMLRNGEGRTSDVDERNWTPLAHAIASGSTAVVSELLEVEADIEATIGQLQTTPLQWAIWHKELDIVRLLLQNGASQDHINTWGWSVLFFCWARLRHGERNMLDFLNLLESDMFQDLDVVDTKGWTVLDRVAAFGQPDEVEALLRLGANPRREAMPLRWCCLHQAVFEGNCSTFKTLLDRFGDEATTIRDARGWTLLHIAASAGHNDIVRHLLQIGADPQARSRPYYTHMPDALHGRECTPQEVAGAQGHDREQQYLHALKDHGVWQHYRVELDDDDDGQLKFWEASEVFAC